MIWLPSLAGILTFAMLNQLWSETMRVSETERVETEIIGHLNQSIRNWGAVSEEYERFLFDDINFSRSKREHAESEMQIELKQAERLAKEAASVNFDPKIIRAIGEIRLLFEREKNTFDTLTWKRSEMLNALSSESLYSEKNSGSVNKVLETALRNLCEIKSTEQAILHARWVSLKKSRADQRRALNKFASAVYVALIANIILSSSLAWFVSAPIARKMRLLILSADNFLHGNLQIPALDSDDEFSYLQNVLRQSFEKIMIAAARRKTIIAMVAHDVRAPLMSANANLNLMEEHSPGFPDEAIDVLMEVYTCLSQVLETAEQILGDEKDIPPELFNSDSSDAVDTRLAGGNNSASIASPRSEWLEPVTRPKLFQQLLLLAILPLIIQIGCLSLIGAQLEKALVETNKASQCSDILILTNLTLLSSLVATTQRGVYLLTGDLQANKAAREYLEFALATNQQSLVAAGTDTLAREYTQLFSRELSTLNTFFSEVKTKQGLAASLNMIVRVDAQHGLSPEGNNARMLESAWVRTNMTRLYDASLRAANQTRLIRIIIGPGLLLYLASELTVLLFFYLSTDERLQVLIKEASLVGKAGFKDVSRALSGTDEISELGRSLEKADAKLTEAAVKRQIMLRYLSKEMSDPLMQVRADEKKILFLAKDYLSEKGLKYLTNSLDSIAQVLTVMDDLLTIESLVGGTGKLKCDEFTSVDLCEKAVTAVTGLARLKDITIKTDCQPGTFYAESTRLVRVLINVISNAIKFSPPGTSIRLTSRFEPGALRIEVADEGPGISQDGISKVFEPGYRVDVPYQSEQGHGLGLAISKMIVESHGGEIGVVSESGKGSIFYFTIPGPAITKVV